MGPQGEDGEGGVIVAFRGEIPCGFVVMISTEQARCWVSNCGPNDNDIHLFQVPFFVEK